MKPTLFIAIAAIVLIIGAFVWFGGSRGAASFEYLDRGKPITQEEIAQ